MQQVTYCPLDRVSASSSSYQHLDLSATWCSMIGLPCCSAVPSKSNVSDLCMLLVVDTCRIALLDSLMEDLAVILLCRFGHAYFILIIRKTGVHLALTKRRWQTLMQTVRELIEEVKRPISVLTTLPTPSSCHPSMTVPSEPPVCLTTRSTISAMYKQNIIQGSSHTDTEHFIRFTSVVYAKPV